MVEILVYDVDVCISRYRWNNSTIICLYGVSSYHCHCISSFFAHMLYISHLFFIINGQNLVALKEIVFIGLCSCVFHFYFLLRIPTFSCVVPFLFYLPGHLGHSEMGPFTTH